MGCGALFSHQRSERLGRAPSALPQMDLGARGPVGAGRPFRVSSFFPLFCSERVRVLVSGPQRSLQADASTTCPISRLRVTLRSAPFLPPITKRRSETQQGPQRRGASILSAN